MRRPAQISAHLPVFPIGPTGQRWSQLPHRLIERRPQRPTAILEYLERSVQTSATDPIIWQSKGVQLQQPLAFLHVTLALRQIFRVAHIHEIHFQAMPFQHFQHWHPGGVRFSEPRGCPWRRECRNPQDTYRAPRWSPLQRATTLRYPGGSGSGPRSQPVCRISLQPRNRKSCPTSARLPKTSSTV